MFQRITITASDLHGWRDFTSNSSASYRQAEMRSPLSIFVAENLCNVALQALKHGFQCFQGRALFAVFQTVERRFRDPQFSGEFRIRHVSPFLSEKHP